MGAVPPLALPASTHAGGLPQHASVPLNPNPGTCSCMFHFSCPAYQLLTALPLACYWLVRQDARWTDPPRVRVSPVARIVWSAPCQVVLAATPRCHARLVFAEGARRSVAGLCVRAACWLCLRQLQPCRAPWPRIQLAYSCVVRELCVRVRVPRGSCIEGHGRRARPAVSVACHHAAWMELRVRRACRVPGCPGSVMAGGGGWCAAAVTPDSLTGRAMS